MDNHARDLARDAEIRIDALCEKNPDLPPLPLRFRLADAGESPARPWRCQDPEQGLWYTAGLDIDPSSYGNMTGPIRDALLALALATFADSEFRQPGESDPAQAPLLNHLQTWFLSPPRERSMAFNAIVWPGTAIAIVFALPSSLFLPLLLITAVLLAARTMTTRPMRAVRLRAIRTATELTSTNAVVDLLLDSHDLTDHPRHGRIGAAWRRGFSAYPAIDEQLAVAREHSPRQARK